MLNYFDPDDTPYSRAELMAIKSWKDKQFQPFTGKMVQSGVSYASVLSGATS
jgi:hypothetical protein